MTEKVFVVKNETGLHARPASLFVQKACLLYTSVKIPLRDIQKAYELAATPGTYRVSVDLQEI